jgi:putative ABC transport system permease protein
MVARVRAVPGVLRAAETFIVPMDGSTWNERIVIGGQRKDGRVSFNEVGGEFFAAMETPLLAGRTFDVRDRLGAPEATIVNESFARRYFPDGSPVGETFQIDAVPGRPQPLYHIVGLVRDTKYLNLREELMPIAYLPVSQERDPAPRLCILVRSDLPPASLTPALTRAILEVTPGASVSYDTIRRYIQDSLVTDRLMASLSGFFGVLAMLIATIGLYGLMSYMVTRRRVEIGIRMALGADRRTVVRMVLGESGVLLAAGVGIGVVLALTASRWLATLLYGLEPWDPAAFAIAAVALGLVSLLASWMPARRASQLEPTIALRE